MIPAADVYRELSAGLDPHLEAIGLRRLRSKPVWRSAVDEEGNTVFLSLQIDSKATDAFSGGSFLMELEHSKTRQPARGLNGRALFFQLLTLDELQRVLAQQNAVISSLPKPPPEHIELYPEGDVREMYLSYFREQRAFDAIRSWLKYHTISDLRDWVAVFTPLLGPLVERARIYLSPDRRDLGEGSLLPAS